MYHLSAFAPAQHHRTLGNSPACAPNASLSDQLFCASGILTVPSPRGRFFEKEVGSFPTSRSILLSSRAPRSPDEVALHADFLLKASLEVRAAGRRAVNTLAGGNMAQNLVIIHFNDVYNVEPRPGLEPVGGAARFCAAVRSFQHLQPLVLFSGDAFSPSMRELASRKYLWSFWQSKKFGCSLMCLLSVIRTMIDLQNF